MNIGIYEEHAFLITNLDKVTRNYAFAECQARFTQACNLRRGETEVVCRGERIQPPENAYDKAFYGQEAYAGRAVSWMEHDAQWWGLHIYYQMCGHGRERRRPGHPVDGFCNETNTLFQFHACLPMTLLSKVFSRTAKRSGRFRKNKARQERADKRDAVCANVGKKAGDPRRGFRADRGLGA